MPVANTVSSAERLQACRERVRKLEQKKASSEALLESHQRELDALKAEMVEKFKVSSVEELKAGIEALEKKLTEVLTEAEGVLSRIGSVA